MGGTVRGSWTAAIGLGVNAGHFFNLLHRYMGYMAIALGVNASHVFSLP
jgi:hypothetical protein